MDKDRIVNRIFNDLSAGYPEFGVVENYLVALNYENIYAIFFETIDKCLNTINCVDLDLILYVLRGLHPETFKFLKALVLELSNGCRPAHHQFHDGVSVRIKFFLYVSADKEYCCACSYNPKKYDGDNCPFKYGLFYFCFNFQFSLKCITCL